MSGMSSERWRQVDAMLAAALDRAPGERAAFLDTACAGDAALRREVGALLAGEAHAERVLGESPSEFAAPLMDDLRAGLGASATEPLPAGQRIGPYRLLEEIGRGGMGAVYRAERADGEFEKQVALKLVKRGMDTDEILRRFRYERQILASLEHPQIARFYDGGVSDDGRPYLVMEYVEGEAITDYCERRSLGVEERLALFGTACEAVRYAHQKLVVHRDLKPSNILVTEPGAVKLLDFGIAKLLAAEPLLSTPETRTGARVLTPEYASPEQLRGEPVTTASDLYQLGVLLYQLLTGRRPRPVSGRTPAGVEATLAAREPERPSAAVARSSNPAADRLARRLRGDLDTIVLTALAEEPERRYASVEALAGDLRRHLGGLPIEARPARAAYRAAKFARRHRVSVTAAALVVLSLLAGLGAALWQAERAARERDRAERERDKAGATVAFMTELFEGADPDRVGGDTLTVFDLLDRGAARVETELAGQPMVLATVQNVLGVLYIKLGDLGRAAPLLEDALAAHHALHVADHPDRARTMLDVALLRYRQADYEAADSFYRRAVEMRRRLAPGDSREVAAALTHWADMLTDRGRFDDAEDRYREALGMLERLPFEHAEEIAASRFGLASLLRYHGRFEEAEPVFRDVLQIRRERFGDLHDKVAVTLNDLGILLYERDRNEEAEAALREALEIRRKLYGDGHLVVAVSLHNLALIPRARGEYDAAQALLRQSLEIKERLYGRDHREVALSLNQLAWIALDRGDLRAAEALFREGLAIMQRVAAAESPDVALLLGNVGRVLHLRGRHGEAEPYLRSALAIRIAVHGEPSVPVTSRRLALADLLRDRQRYEEAEDLYLSSLADWGELRDEGGENVGRVRQSLISLYHAWGRPEQAEAMGSPVIGEPHRR